MAYILVKIDGDNDVRNPTEDDCQWKVASFNVRHRSWRSRMDFYGIGWRRKLEVGTAFLLHYQEHGLCSWSLYDGVYEDLFSADGIAWFERPRELGSKDYAGRQRDCKAFLACYTNWCNGAGLGYSVALIDGDLDDEDEPIGAGCEVDSDACYGFYQSDSDYLLDEVAATVRRFQREHGPDFRRGLGLVFAGDYGQDYRDDIETRLATLIKAESVAALT